jgi:hypothetical protein
LEEVERSQELTIELGERWSRICYTLYLKSIGQALVDSGDWTYVRKMVAFRTLSVTAIKNVSGDVTGYLGIA